MTRRLPVHREWDPCSYRVTDRCNRTCRYWIDPAIDRVSVWLQAQDLGPKGHTARRALEGDPTFATCCSLDVAATGDDRPLEDLALILGVSKQRIDQIERVAWAKVGRELLRRGWAAEMAEFVGGGAPQHTNTRGRGVKRSQKRRLYQLGDQYKTAEAWAAVYNMHGSTVRKRLASGMTISEALGLAEGAAE